MEARDLPSAKVSLKKLLLSDELRGDLNVPERGRQCHCSRVSRRDRNFDWDAFFNEANDDPELSESILEQLEVIMALRAKSASCLS